jgi:hypothetical protein
MDKGELTAVRNCIAQLGRLEKSGALADAAAMIVVIVKVRKWIFIWAVASSKSISSQYLRG